MKKSITTFTGLAMLICMALLSCKEAPKEEPEMMVESVFDLAVAKQEIIDANKEYMDKFSVADSVGIANLYAPDAKFMMNGAPSFVGRAQIQSALSMIIKMGITKVDLVTVDVWGDEDYVTEEGALTLFVGDQQVDQGKYVLLWKNIDGKWYLYRDCFNSDNPPQE